MINCHAYVSLRLWLPSKRTTRTRRRVHDTAVAVPDLSDICWPLGSNAASQRCQASWTRGSIQMLPTSRGLSRHLWLPGVQTALDRCSSQTRQRLATRERSVEQKMHTQTNTNQCEGSNTVKEMNRTAVPTIESRVKSESSGNGAETSNALANCLQPGRECLDCYRTCSVWLQRGMQLQKQEAKTGGMCRLD